MIVRLSNVCVPSFHRGPIRFGFDDRWGPDRPVTESRIPLDIYLYPSGRMTDGGYEPPIPIRPDDGWGTRTADVVLRNSGSVFEHVFFL